MVDAVSNTSAPTPNSRDAETQARSLEERLRQALPPAKEEDKSAEKPRSKRHAEGSALPLGLVAPLPETPQLGRHAPSGKSTVQQAGKKIVTPLGASGLKSKAAKSAKSDKEQQPVKATLSTKTPEVADREKLATAGASKHPSSEHTSADKEHDKLLQSGLSASSAHNGLTPSYTVKQPATALPRPVWAQPPEIRAESTRDSAGMTYQFKSWGAGHAVNLQRNVGEDGQVNYLLQPSSSLVEQHLRDHPLMPQDAQLMRDPRDQQGQSGQDAQDQAQDEEA